MVARRFRYGLREAPRGWASGEDRTMLTPTLQDVELVARGLHQAVTPLTRQRLPCDGMIMPRTARGL